MVITPVLFETFARPLYARQVFDAIKKAKPKKLYFYSNKARTGNLEEIKNNEEIRDYLNEIDWECNVQTYFRDDYVDVYTSLKGAMDWVFDNEEAAIILEEDCVPSLAFFDFVDQLIPKYQNDLRIQLITGDNYCEEYNPNGYDIIFSRSTYMAGWATWKDRWEKTDWVNIPLEEMHQYGLFKQIYNTKRQQKYYAKAWEIRKDFLIKTHCWDYLFNLECFRQNALSIVPTRNLVTNVGVVGAHSVSKTPTHNVEKSNEDLYTIKSIPPFVAPDILYDNYAFIKLIYKNQLFYKRVIYKLKSIIHKRFSL